MNMKTNVKRTLISFCCAAALLLTAAPRAALLRAEETPTPTPTPAPLEESPTPTPTPLPTVLPTPTAPPSTETEAPGPTPAPSYNNAHPVGSVIDLEVLSDPQKSYAPGEAFEFKVYVKNLSSKGIPNMQVSLKPEERSAFMLDPDFDKALSAKDPQRKDDPARQETLDKQISMVTREGELLRFKLRAQDDLSGRNGKLKLLLRFTPQPETTDSQGCPLRTSYAIEQSYELKLALPAPSVTPDATVVPDLPGDSGYYSSYGFSTGEAAGSSEAVKNKPKLIVTKYSLEPQMPRAGEEFTLNMTFYNTNEDKSCRNIKIILSTDAAPSTQGSNGNGAPSGNQVGNVFTPVNSSNTFYIGRIEPQKEAEKSITFSVGPTVASKNYTMFVKFEYEDADGNQLEANESIGIPVVQQAKIETDEIKLQDFAMVNESIMLDFNVYNVGKDNLSNLMIEYVGKMKADPPRNFVGNFASGASSQFSTLLTPLEPGQENGKIVVSYEDSTGKKQTVEKTFSMTVEEPISDLDALGKLINPETGLPFDQGFAEPQPLWMNPFVWAGAAALLGLVVLLVVLRKRRNSKLKKDLTLDE